MKARKLVVEGALEFTPISYPDERGLFVSPFQGSAFAEAAEGTFPIAQTNHSMSRRGVVRGVHYTRTPPGCAKYVYCPRGSALDIVVDIRVGSPTFGLSDVVLMDQLTFCAMYFPVGVGHAFVALEDDTVMSYMITSGYVPANELAISVFDPELALPIPTDIDHVISERDRAAMALSEARERGLLPEYAHSLGIERREGGR
ncbi:dTDP-4-dehydrorhamnose 3,5-epimerase family protein [Actinomadura sp. HBU206391]|uniref:dTDP-4-dehydrorhamnose 3,5-epimerase family protein n=1 Tax=Actinomadura sp. HBU206391 TaxID=2731692 RepID=UPI001650CF3B|nr:dTDP-4-dehydrorhamnose 3,5-epimerase [Actinomadura sp. HBU206391]MBC6456920.1 dTDP-4-dehydrorhamnose 3,5-epimerase family protein [Actinomadura sp. HBU206391]